MHSIRQQGKISPARKLSVAALALTTLSILLTLTTSVHAQIPTPTVLYSFQGGTTDIYLPSGILAQGRDGNLYGTGQSRGQNQLGGVYKYDPSTGVESLIASFTWQGCNGLTLGLDGNFYGACGFDGAHGYGLVFRVTPTGELTDIYDFTDSNGDGNPATVPVLGANGDLYGTTGQTNAACGNIYRVTTAGVYKYIQGGPPFCGTNQLSAASNGIIYGAWGQTATAGNRGAIFAVNAAGTYDEIYDFLSTSPSEYPATGPILASDGKLIGTDIGEGTNGNGAIFSLTTNGKTLTDLYNISSDADGALEYNNPIQASNGNFYGASYNGGVGNQGSFWEMTSDNVFSVFLLGSDNALYGTNPGTQMTQHTNGSLYSTTESNGTPGYGTFVSFDIGASQFIALVSPVPAGLEGSTVQILGQGFSSSSKVEFGGTAATKIAVSGSTFIEAIVPAGALTGKITVTTGSTTLSTLVTFKITPKQTGFNPPSGDVGTVVTITGTGLEQTTGVKFNGTTAAFTVDSDTQITATVPTGATTGKIAVTTKGGSTASSSSFTVD